MPVGVQGLGSGAAGVSAGAYHTCALTTGGGVQCWGLNANGQVGNGSMATPVLTPAAVSGLSTGVTAIAAAGNHACALTTAGAVQCWGLDANGELGNNGTTDSPVPVAVVEP